MRMQRTLWLTSASLALCALPSVVSAQTADEGQQTTTEIGAQEITTQDIVVTAQGRAQSLQRVPIAIAAVEGKTFQQRVILDLESLTPQLGSVTLAESPFQRTVAIRGLGSTGGNIGYEQSAPLFVDGVFGGRGGQFVLPFFDLSRIEVVKGPQAIFFGKNATAGAISIVSARPTSTFYASINSGYEVQNGGYIAEGIVSGPLSPALRARLSIHGSRKGDYLFDTSADRHVGGADEFGIRGGLEWDATSNLSFYLKGEYSKRNADRRFQLACAAPGATQVSFAGATVECVEDQRLSSGAINGPFAAAFPPGSDFDNSDAYNAVLVTDLMLGEHKLEATTGYSAFTSQNQDGLDRSAIGVATSSTGENFDQISQELRLLSPTGNLFEYVVGGLFIHARHRVNQTVAQALPILVGDYIHVDQSSDAYSAFGKLTWNITDKLHLSAGARFTHEKKNYASTVSRTLDPAQIAVLDVDNFPTNPLAVFPQDLRRSESSFDPSGTIEWNPARGLLIYASIARGTKAGGFEFFPRALAMPVSPSAIQYGEERALNFEGGFKVTFAAGKGQLNGSIFYNKLTGLQNQVLNIAILGFEDYNAQRAHSAGFELEGFVNPVEQIKIGGNVAYLDAKYDRFEFPSRNVNYTGNRLPFAPEWSGNGYVDGKFDLSSNLVLNTHLQVNYTDRMSFDASNNPADNGRPYATVDLRVGFSLPTQKLEFAVSGRNILDKQNIRIFSNPTLLSLALPALNPRGVLLTEGRTVFLTVKKEF